MAKIDDPFILKVLQKNFRYTEYNSVYKYN
jgi:hypothetical protein